MFNKTKARIEDLEGRSEAHWNSIWDLRDRVRSLESQVKLLETQVKELQDVLIASGVCYRDCTKFEGADKLYSVPTAHQVEAIMKHLGIRVEPFHHSGYRAVKDEVKEDER